MKSIKPNRMKSISIFLIGLTIVTSFSCKKEGTGGEASISAITKHHDRAIPFTTIYIKYGAKEFPGTDVSKYDATQVADKTGHTHFEGLIKGDYYLYGVGYDSAAQAPVKGGVPVTIKRSERKKETDVNVPVTE